MFVDFTVLSEENISNNDLFKLKNVKICRERRYLRLLFVKFSLLCVIFLTSLLHFFRNVLGMKGSNKFYVKHLC